MGASDPLGPGTLSPAFRLRRSVDGDADFLLELFAQSHAAGLPLELVRLQFDAQRAAYSDRFPSAERSIIEVDGVPAGSILVDVSGDHVRIVDVATLPACRGRGIGGAVIASCCEDAALAGKPVRLSVQRGNPAEVLYRRLGFRVTGGEGLYIEMIRP